jgi:ubiquinone/menaquinone biosynthesis C-methylase UbiE
MAIPAPCGIGFVLIVSLALPVAPSPVFAQDARYLAPPGAPAHSFPAPERPVADIVSPARSHEAKRNTNDETGQLVRLMGLKPGMTVGDIGAGNGYHTLRLSKVVGPTGVIIAQDVTAHYLAELGRRAKRQKLENVRLALGEAHDPRLPPASLDAAILVHMYHEVGQPFAFLYNLIPALKPGARIGIVDLDRPTADHGTPPALLRCELTAVGFHQAAFHKLEGDDAGYLAIFVAPSATRRKRPAEIAACPANRG